MERTGLRRPRELRPDRRLQSSPIGGGSATSRRASWTGGSTSTICARAADPTAPRNPARHGKISRDRSITPESRLILRSVHVFLSFGCLMCVDARGGRQCIWLTSERNRRPHEATESEDRPGGPEGTSQQRPHGSIRAPVRPVAARAGPGAGRRGAVADSRRRARPADHHDRSSTSRLVLIAALAQLALIAGATAFYVRGTGHSLAGLRDGRGARLPRRDGGGRPLPRAGAAARAAGHHRRHHPVPPRAARPPRRADRRDGVAARTAARGRAGSARTAPRGPARRVAGG